MHVHVLCIIEGRSIRWKTTNFKSTTQGRPSCSKEERPWIQCERRAGVWTRNIRFSVRIFTPEKQFNFSQSEFNGLLLFLLLLAVLIVGLPLRRRDFRWETR